MQKSAAAGTLIAYIDHVRITIYTRELLPVDLISFTAKEIGNVVQLSWSTASEVNNDYFNIEKSNDALNFSTIASIAGNGSKASISEYSYLDESVMSDVNYYRITQVDFDGQATQHNIVAVKNTITFASAENIVFPNPSSGIVNVDTSKLRGANIKSMEVFDMQGNKLNSLDISSFANISITQPPGIYIICISASKLIFYSRLVIE